MVEFKTIHDCRVELVAHTKQYDKDEYEDGTFNADFLPVSAARASYGNEDKTGKDEKADKKLMKFLAEHKHMTPFEYNHATFYVECPLFVLSQIKTHRTQKSLDLATNVISRRYTSEKISFWIPDKWRKQSQNNKQCSLEDELSFPFKMGLAPSTASMVIPGNMSREYGVEKTERQHTQGRGLSTIRDAYVEVLALYEDMISAGICREQARAVLPEALITSMYIGGTLRNWAGFIELRSSENVQEETRVIANRIEKALKELWPNATEHLL